MISSGNQNQFPSSLAPIGDLLKVFMFLLNLNIFNSSPSLPNQVFAKRKGSSKVRKEKGLSDLATFSLSPFLVFEYALLMCFCFLVLGQSSFMLCFV